jgi:HEPN domain-containing protein
MAEMNRSSFRRVAARRLRDARALLRARCYSGAYYVAGYAVECALKACIARQTRATSYPPKPNVVRDGYCNP